MRLLLRTLLLVMAAATFAGCATYSAQVYPVTQQTTAEAVRIGDKVHAVTKDGDKTEFQVVALTTQGVRGTDVAFAYSELETLAVVEQRRSSRKLDGYSIMFSLLGAAAGLLVIDSSSSSE